jgi:hypothetical protein
MEGYCSTGQSPQQAVVPMEEEEDPAYDHHYVIHLLLRTLKIKSSK